MKLRAARLAPRGVRLPLPTIAVGNLSVGGTGKTPPASWIARYRAAHGRRPGVLLRGYGGDEELVHRRLAPEADVAADPGRGGGARGARRGRGEGRGRGAGAGGGRDRRSGELRGAGRGQGRGRATAGVSRSSPLPPGRSRAARASRGGRRLCCSH